PTGRHPAQPTQSAPVEIAPPRVVDSRSIPRLPVEPAAEISGPGVKGRFGDPGLSSRISLLEMQFRRLLTCAAVKLDQADRAPARRRRRALCPLRHRHPPPHPELAILIFCSPVGPNPRLCICPAPYFSRFHPKCNPPKTTQINPQYPIQPLIFPIRRISLAYPLTDWQTIHVERPRRVPLGRGTLEMASGDSVWGLFQLFQVGLVGP